MLYVFLWITLNFKIVYSLKAADYMDYGARFYRLIISKNWVEHPVTLEEGGALLPAKLLVSNTFVPLLRATLSVLPTTLIAVYLGRSEVNGWNTADNTPRYFDAFSLW